MAPTTSQFSCIALPFAAHAKRRISQLLNEIMPMIYKRFTEKSAEEWRQIYKVRAHCPITPPQC